MKHAKKIYMTTALVLALAFTGCNQNEKKAETTAPENQPAKVATQETKDTAMPAQANAEASVAATLQPEAAQGALTGTVVETFDSGGYTYIQLDTGSDKVWAAIGQTKVAVGDKISLLNGPVMRDFHSKSLDRTFPEIIFSSGMAGANAAPPAGMGQNFSQAMQGEGGGAMPPAAMGMGAEESSGGSVKAITPLQEVKVEKAEGANAYNVEEVFTSAADLAGKKVKVRGKVVKVSPGIMGRTWIHLQDGTGDPMKNTHDLVVTSAEVPELNSIVVVEGELAKDKDFGAGYFYNVIVEGATVNK
ncbi:MAG: DNA-binding protein [Proteobacteria bacterium]|nr:DNA-binding protein [Pseudomonadota bacterium]MBU4295791.1 DNA-binding protein [Pseudomonadota bacterium]MCG2747816.1 DNA-binding protein [Desulfobulbaceae bacterium]